MGTPVVVHEEGGALQETGVLSGGGLGYRSDGELLLALRRMIHDEELRAELAAQASPSALENGPRRRTFIITLN